MEAIDILLMAKGSAAEVGYRTDAKLIGDLCDLGYEEYSRGLVHSHASMAVNPSHTDIEQLKLAASTGPYYLSVIVNNRLEVKAMVAIKSEEIYTGYSFFRNLKGKHVKVPKEYKTESYEVIDVEVDIQIPKYIQDVNERMKDIQLYHTPHQYTPVGSGNKLQTDKDVNRIPGSVYGPISGYGNQRPAYTKNKTYPQTELWTDGYKTTEEDEEYDMYEGFIEAAIQKYSKVNNKYLTAYEIASNIKEDSEGYGLAVGLYIEYLTNHILVSEDFTDKLIGFLEK